MERSVRKILSARRVSDKSKSPLRFQGATAVVVAAHYCDFAQVIAKKQADRRETLAARAEQVVLDAMIAEVPHIVVISTAMVAGTYSHRAIITDDDPLITQQQGYVGDVVAFEVAFADAVAGLPATYRPKITILRPAAVVGPGIDTLVTRHFEAPRVLGIKGEHKRWQFAHVIDIAHAVDVAIREEIEGTLVVGSVHATENNFVADELDTPTVLALMGMRGVEISRELAFSTADRLHKVGVLPAPAHDLEMAVYPWNVFPARLLEAGWRSQVSSEQCVREISEQTRGKIGVAGRRVGHRDAAALGAAGAAVALISTAAIWRQARGGAR